MIRRLSSVVLTSVLFIGVGCASEEYKPQSKPTQLAAYAASTPYPRDATSQLNPKITAVVSRSTGQLTLRNFDLQPLRNFDVWINRSYVLHVDRMDPDRATVLNPADVYNASGNNLVNVPADSIRQVQLEMHGQLYDVQGPQMNP